MSLRPTAMWSAKPCLSVQDYTADRTTFLARRMAAGATDEFTIMSLMIDGTLAVQVINRAARGRALWRARVGVRVGF
jgi:hypothetical protein